MGKSFRNRVRIGIRPRLFLGTAFATVAGFGIAEPASAQVPSPFRLTAPDIGVSPKDTPRPKPADVQPFDLTVRPGVRAERMLDAQGEYGDVTTTGDNMPAISLVNPGNVTINAGTVNTAGASSNGIDVSGGGSASIKVDGVATAGDYSTGIRVDAAGDLTVVAGAVTTAGTQSAGIDARSDTGAVSITAGAVETASNGSKAIYARGADVTVNAGDVTTKSFGSSGLVGVASGDGALVDLSINGAVTTYAGFSAGVVATSDGDISIHGSGPVSTFDSINSGFLTGHSDAVRATAKGDIDINLSGAIFAGGDTSAGVRAQSYGGSIRVNVGDISTHGSVGAGIYASTVSYDYSTYTNHAAGPVSIAAHSITTEGDYASGILTKSSAADVTVTGDIKTAGNGANAIDVRAYAGNATVHDSTSLSTTGGGSSAVVASAYGNVVIDGGAAITTTGLGSAGVVARAIDGSISITEGDINTRAGGVYAVAGHSVDAAGRASSSITITTGDIHTSGSGGAASGVLASNNNLFAPTSVSTGNISTIGDYAAGAYARSLNGKTTIHTGDVSTKGIYAYGVAAAGGDVAITSGAISTQGNHSDGIGILGLIPLNYAPPNKIDVNAVSIKTSGASASGVYAHTFGSDINLAIGSVTTSGSDALGIHTRSQGEGSVVVSSNDVTTSGDASTAIALFNYTQGNATVTVSGSVATAGRAAYGVFALTGGDLKIDVNDIRTAGKFGYGAIGISIYGDASIHANSVATLGDKATGVYLSGGHAVSFDLGTVTTAGTGSKGVLVDAGGDDQSGSVSGKVASVTTTGDFASGAAVYSNAAHTMLAIGTAVTKGGFSDAVFVSAAHGDAGLTATTLSTTGDYAIGAEIISSGAVSVMAASVATSGRYSNGVDVRTSGNISITSNVVTTAGLASSGILAWSGAPSDMNLSLDPGAGTPTKITVNAGAISATGVDAAGIWARNDYGAIGISATAITASGSGSVGVMAQAKDAISISSGGLTSATDGIVASSSGGGAIDINTLGKLVAGGVGLSAKTAGVVEIAVGSASGITAGGDAIQISAAGPVSIANQGQITSVQGFAISVAGGPVKLTNAGAIQGAISFSDGDDVFTNSGTFEASKDSTFGGGSDIFLNSGTMRVLPGTASAGHVTLLGLERFENSGLIDLRNGHAGDTLTLPGSFIGTSHSALGLDVSFGGSTGAGASDQLVVAGAATGSTAVTLNVLDATTATMGRAPTALIKVGAGSSANAFTIVNPDVGFVRYALSYDAATSSYGLIGAAGAPVHRTLNLGEGVQNVWNRGSDNWESHLADQRDMRWATGDEPSRLWGQAYAGGDSRSDAHAAAGASAVVLDYRQTYNGAQIGYDIGGISGDAGGTVFGVTASYITSKLTSRTSLDRSTLDTLSLGGYASFVSNRFFASGIVQYAHDWVKTDNDQLAWSARMTSDLYGGAITAGYRLGTDSFYVEPLASVSIVHASLGSLDAFGQSIDFDGENGVRGKAGARVGAAVPVKGGGKIVFYVSGTAVHQFANDGGLTFTSGGVSQKIGNTTIGTYGQGTVGATFVSAGRFSGFVEANGDAGGSFTGGGGRVGVSIKF